MSAMFLIKIMRHASGSVKVILKRSINSNQNNSDDSANDMWQKFYAVHDVANISKNLLFSFHKYLHFLFLHNYSFL